MKILFIALYLLVEASALAKSNAQLEELLLDLGDAATNSNFKAHKKNLHKSNLDKLGIEIIKTYNDDFSGFQAYQMKIKSMEKDFSHPVRFFAISATQIFYLNDEGERKNGFDIRDWVSNAAYGYPQLISDAVGEMAYDIYDFSKKGQAILTGSSLGGMIATPVAYLATRLILKENLHNFLKPKVITFATPGVRFLIERYLDEKFGEEINEEVIDKMDVTNFIFDLDIVSKVGEPIGETFVFPPKYILPKDTQGYSIEIPLFQQTLESHLHASFKRALNENGMEEKKFLKRFQFTVEGVLLSITKPLAMNFLRSRYRRKFRSTQEAFNECLRSAQWRTNFMTGCTSKWQFGCSKEVMKHKDAKKVYRENYMPAGTRIVSLPRIRWCEVVEK